MRSKAQQEALAGISWWQRGARKEARKNAAVAATAEIARLEQQRQEQWAAHQKSLDGWWGGLVATDPQVVLPTLDDAFADNTAHAVAVDCEGDRTTVVMVIDAEDQVPERKPAVTPSGKPTLHKLNKTERSELYRGWVFSNVLATVRETLAVAPGINRVTMVVLRRDPPNAYGELFLSAIYAGTLARDQCSRIAWNTPAALDAVMDAEDLLIHQQGQARSLVPIDLSTRADLANLVRQFEATIRGPVEDTPGQAQVESGQSASRGE